MKIFILSVTFNEFSKFAKLYNHKPLLFCNAVSFPCVWHLVFDCIEAYAPGFKGSVVGRDILTPPDLERVFGLPGGVSLGPGCKAELRTDQGVCPAMPARKQRALPALVVLGPSPVSPLPTLMMDLQRERMWPLLLTTGSGVGKASTFL